MTLNLYYHPLASFSHKVLIALYENATPFNAVMVNLGDRVASAEFFALWPIGKIPVLRDDSRGQSLPETTIIIEYLQQHYPGPRALLPHDESLRLETRLWDRFFDLYIQVPMQRIVGDRMRPESEKDPRTVAEAQATLRTAYAILENRMKGRTWVVGDDFSMADCAAAPGLFYISAIFPFAAEFPNIAAYFDRLAARPSFARTLAEARPYLQYFPFHDTIPARFLHDDAAKQT